MVFFFRILKKICLLSFSKIKNYKKKNPLEKIKYKLN